MAEGQTVVTSKWYWVLLLKIAFISKPEKKRVFPGFFSQLPESRVLKFCPELETLRRTAFALPIHVSISLFPFPSLVNTTLRYLNVSTCCSVFPLTCGIHCLGRLERHNTSIFLVLIFFLLGHTQQKTDQLRAEDPVEKIHACGTSLSVKSKRFILHFPTVTPSLTRLRLSIKFI